MMNVVNAGSRYQIYGEDVKTYKELPVQTYDVEFNKMVGFYLTERSELRINEEKVYGNHLKKVAKVLKSFKITNRNLGIILSGTKGIGKSLFARMLADEAAKQNLPVLVVSAYIPGIADFLSSIEQEVVIIFDEFEKVFSISDDDDPQAELLSLFDGLDSGKKLFVLTCNETRKLNSYLLNRPGRIHYHFTLTNPSEEEITEYLTDKLNVSYHNLIQSIVNLSKTTDLTYDYLRALAFEINQGYSLQESLDDLNITRTSDTSFDIKVYLTNGKVFHAYNRHLDLYEQKESRWIDCRGDGKTAITIQFKPSDVKIENNILHLNGSLCKFKIDDEDLWDLSDDEREKAEKELNNVDVAEVVFVKNSILDFNRYVAL